jgi:hypothetical protein
MSVAARVIRNGLLAAVGTRIEMPAQSRRAAALESPEHFQLLITESVLMLFEKAAALSAKEVGHLQGRPAHGLL